MYAKVLLILLIHRTQFSGIEAATLGHREAVDERESTQTNDEPPELLSDSKPSSSVAGGDGTSKRSCCHHAVAEAVPEAVGLSAYMPIVIGHDVPPAAVVEPKAEHTGRDSSWWSRESAWLADDGTDEPVMHSPGYANSPVSPHSPGRPHSPVSGRPADPARPSILEPNRPRTGPPARPPISGPSSGRPNRPSIARRPVSGPSPGQPRDPFISHHPSASFPPQSSRRPVSGHHAEIPLQPSYEAKQPLKPLKPNRGHSPAASTHRIKKPNRPEIAKPQPVSPIAPQEPHQHKLPVKNPSKPKSVKAPVSPKVAGTSKRPFKFSHTYQGHSPGEVKSPNAASEINPGKAPLMPIAASDVKNPSSGSVNVAEPNGPKLPEIHAPNTPKIHGPFPPVDGVAPAAPTNPHFNMQSSSKYEVNSPKAAVEPAEAQGFHSSVEKPIPPQQGASPQGTAGTNFKLDIKPPKSDSGHHINAPAPPHIDVQHPNTPQEIASANMPKSGHRPMPPKATGFQSSNSDPQIEAGDHIHQSESPNIKIRHAYKIVSPNPPENGHGPVAPDAAKSHFGNTQQMNEGLPINPSESHKMKVQQPNTPHAIASPNPPENGHGPVAPGGIGFHLSGKQQNNAGNHIHPPESPNIEASPQGSAGTNFNIDITPPKADAEHHLNPPAPPNIDVQHPITPQEVASLKTGHRPMSPKGTEFQSSNSNPQIEAGDHIQQPESPNIKIRHPYKIVSPNPPENGHGPVAPDAGKFHFGNTQQMNEGQHINPPEHPNMDVQQPNAPRAIASPNTAQNGHGPVAPGGIGFHLSGKQQNNAGNHIHAPESPNIEAKHPDAPYQIASPNPPENGHGPATPKGTGDRLSNAQHSKAGHHNHPPESPNMAVQHPDAPHSIVPPGHPKSGHLPLQPSNSNEFHDGHLPQHIIAGNSNQPQSPHKFEVQPPHAPREIASPAHLKTGQSPKAPKFADNTPIMSRGRQFGSALHDANGLSSALANTAQHANAIHRAHPPATPNIDVQRPDNPAAIAAPNPPTSGHGPTAPKGGEFHQINTPQHSDASHHIQRSDSPDIEAQQPHVHHIIIAPNSPKNGHDPTAPDAPDSIPSTASQNIESPKSVNIGMQHVFDGNNIRVPKISRKPSRTNHAYHHTAIGKALKQMHRKTDYKPEERSSSEVKRQNAQNVAGVADKQIQTDTSNSKLSAPDVGEISRSPNMTSSTEQMRSDNSVIQISLSSNERKIYGQQQIAQNMHKSTITKLYPAGSQHVKSLHHADDKIRDLSTVMQGDAASQSAKSRHAPHERQRPDSQDSGLYKASSTEHVQRRSLNAIRNPRSSHSS